MLELVDGGYYDVIIVGGGIAGLSAALYAARQNLKVQVISKDIGGQASLTQHIENYPGIRIVSGLELAQIIKEQAEEFGAEFLYDEVIKVYQINNSFTVSTRLSGDFESIAVILAFGKSPKELGVPGEEKFVGRGVSYCAICDAPLYRNKKVAVVGWGDHALDASKLLCSYNNKVYLIYKSAASIVNENLLAECRGMDITMMPSTEVIEIKGDSKVRSIRVRNIKTNEVQEIEVDGVFVEMGYVPKTEWVKDLVQLNDKGEIIIDKYCRTSRPGVFAAGDVTDTPYKQAIIAAAQGAIAALSAYNYIQSIKGRPTIKGDWKAIKK